MSLCAATRAHGTRRLTKLTLLHLLQQDDGLALADKVDRREVRNAHFVELFEGPEMHAALEKLRGLLGVLDLRPGLDTETKVNARCRQDNEDAIRQSCKDLCELWRPRCTKDNIHNGDIHKAISHTFKQVLGATFAKVGKSSRPELGLFRLKVDDEWKQLSQKLRLDPDAVEHVRAPRAQGWAPRRLGVLQGLFSTK